MPTYQFKCSSCGDRKEMVSTMQGLDDLKRAMICCNGQMGVVITGGRHYFQRSPFPSEPFEHLDYEPRKVRDKKELADLCDEFGLRSRLLEDGDVPL